MIRIIWEVRKRRDGPAQEGDGRQSWMRAARRQASNWLGRRLIAWGQGLRRRFGQAAQGGRSW